MSKTVVSLKQWKQDVAIDDGLVLTEAVAVDSTKMRLKFEVHTRLNTAWFKNVKWQVQQGGRCSSTTSYELSNCGDGTIENIIAPLFPPLQLSSHQFITVIMIGQSGKKISWKIKSSDEQTPLPEYQNETA